MAVGLFELASVAVNGVASSDAVGASCRTCGRTAVIWLRDRFTSLGDASGKCASIENAADFFALMLLSKVVATVGECDVLMFRIFKG